MAYMILQTTENVRNAVLAVPVSGDAYDMTCPFMDDSKLKEKCRIYPVRPEICRQFICKGDKKPFRMKATRYEVVDVRKEFFGE